MKIFIKRFAALSAILFVAIVCMGIVYIDTTANYWNFSGGFIRLVVNTNAQASITIDTNTLRFGINTNNITSSVFILGRTPATNATGNGSSGSTVARININGGNGGSTFDPTSASGASAGGVVLLGGTGGSAPLATTNSGSGNGGAMTLSAGQGGQGGGVATNASTGGNGGAVTISGGTGGSSGGIPTNAVGGAGGGFVISGGQGGSASSGWIRKGGNGGIFQMAGGQGATSVRTNGGDGGGLDLTAGVAGGTSISGNGGAPGEVTIAAGSAAAVTGTGNAQSGASISITAGNGSTGGTTNSDGGRIHLVPGSPGSGALVGDVVIGRQTNGASRGGLQIGPALGGSVSITNVLGGSASLDFPSTAAGTFSDLPITVTGVVSNNCAVSLSVPWMCATNGGAFVTYNSNDTIFVRFLNGNLVTAIDPPAGTFTVVAFRIR